MVSSKRVLIYSEYWSSGGGGEKYLASCIEALLCGGYDITIVAQKTSFDQDALERYFNVNVAASHILLVDGNLNTLRGHAKRISSDFDVVIYMTNYRFFPSRAHHTFVILQIPYANISFLTGFNRPFRGAIKEAAKDMYRRQLLHRLRKDQSVIVYSQFVQRVLSQYHAISSHVVEPPIDDFATIRGQKEHTILSVGRFFDGLYNNKRYDILIEAFKSLRQRLPNMSWQYKIVGSCGSDPASQRYLNTLREIAWGSPVYFRVNSSYEELRRHYAEATLFWHAAGYGIDEEKHPEQMEHFGMSTVEAMSAGCIPVVINKGGQKEIVSHGKSGYLWNTVEELIERSLEVIQNPDIRQHMQKESRQRFASFSRERFSEKFLALIGQLQSTETVSVHR